MGERGAHTEIIVGGDGDPDHAGCTWCGECVRVCPTGAIFEVIPRERFGAEAVRHPDTVTRSVCPYCGVGCQVDLHVKDGQLVRVTSPWIEENTPEPGLAPASRAASATDFAQHRDRLTVPLIRKGWVQEGERLGWTGEIAAAPRGAVAHDRGNRTARRNRARRSAASGKPPQTGLPIVGDGDVRDRATTPAEWYDAFREATWEEAMSLTAQELAPHRDTARAPRARRALLGQVQQRGQLPLHADGARRASAPTAWTTAPGSATPRRWRP